MGETNDDSEEIDYYVEKVIDKVLEAERRKLHMKNPLGIKDEIETIIRELIKE
jgi:hypothetical protein